MASSSSSSSDGNNQVVLLTSLSKTNATVSTSLHRTIQHHTQNKGYNAQTDGLDFLQVKNGLMISYLIDLTMLLKCRLKNNNNSSNSNRNDEDQQQQQQIKEEQCIARLLEMKTALEKIRPLEKRMRYQIDKLLALSTLGAGTFAAVGREQDEEDTKKEEEDKKKKSRRVQDMLLAQAEEEEGMKSDPLSFKPDLQGMMKMFEEDDNEVRLCIVVHACMFACTFVFNSID